MTIEKNIWKEACWYLDLNPVIAVWLMKEHAQKSHNKHTSQKNL